MTDTVPHQYKPCGKKCDSFDNFVNFQSYVISDATERKYYKCQNNTLSLYQMLYIWYIAKNVKSKALGPQFQGNQD